VTRRRRRSNNPEGRPSLGLSEAPVTLRAPRWVVVSMGTRAESMDITTSEAWRRAAVQWLQEGVPSTADEQTTQPVDSPPAPPGAASPR
jgi:hypothetical protein